ncbi:hypothetical protein FSP39_022083 [Pinctada imbricata]|uniref:UDP-glucuronosyltransferase n=1 Tax=Pinctada imbricata TaxID=66713 RepID=A0AA88YL52_PINIB|nr:hypothetical protein FSP39_022083 [Pinctada imbricata]
MMDLRKLIYLVLLFSLCHQAYSSNILCVATPHVSHLLPVVQIGKALKAMYNHSLTIVASDHAINSPLLRNADNHFINSEMLNKLNFVETASKITEEIVKGNFPLFKMIRMFKDICESILQDDDVINKLKDTKFEIMITMPGLAGDCFNYIAYKLSIPIIHYGPFYDAFYHGIPLNPSVTPEFPFAVYGESMTFFQRVKNTMFFYAKPLVTTFVEDGSLSTRFVPEKPYISPKELRNHVQFNLLDFDVLMDYPRPSLPNTAFVGGLNVGPSQRLNSDFQNIMDLASDGIVVVTFGSVFKAFPADKLRNVFDAMKNVKTLTFVMKYGNESRQEGNIYVRPWLPQNDLLAHKNTRAFITHCGNSGQYEGLYHGVPMIGIPVYGDQLYNAERMKNKGYGLYVPLLSVEAESLTNLIEEVVRNPTYKEKVSKAAKIFKSRQGGSPSERAAYWVDHVIKYGGSYMHSISAELPWYIYIGLDVYSFMLSIAVISTLVFVFSIRVVFKFVCKKKKVKTS